MSILRFFRIKPSERRVLAWSAGLAIMVGAILCYISSVPLALFLTHFSSQSLPLIYILGSLTTLAFGLALNYIEPHVSVGRLGVGLVLLLALTAGFFWLLIESGVGKLIFAAMLVWAILAFSLLELAFWMLINRIFMMQQGKRLYGLIGGGQSLGGGLAGFLSPWVIGKIGVNNIILLVSVLSFLASAILFFLQKRFFPDQALKDSHIEVSTSKKNERRSKGILKNHYVLKIMLIAGVCEVGVYIVDMLFNTLAEARYPAEIDLAGFLGTFFGLVDVLDFLCSILLISWLLTRFGVIVDLLVLPIVLVLIGLITGLTHIIPAWVNIVFWCVVVLKLCEETLRATLYETGVLLLLQPLIPKWRAWLQTKIETFILPFSVGLTGVFLLIISHTLGVSVGYFSLFIVILFGLLAWLVLGLKKEYLTALSAALSNHNFIRPAFERLDKYTLPLFEKYLTSPHPEEVAYVLSTLERIDELKFIRELPRAFSSDNEDLRKFALEKVREYKAYQYTDVVKNLAVNDPSVLIRAEALIALASEKNQAILAWVGGFLHDESLSIKTAASIGILRYAGGEYQREVLEILSSMQNQNDIEVQLACVEIIKGAENTLSNELLPLFFQSPHREVKAVALNAIIQLRLESFYSFFVENISYDNLEYGILDDLPSLGDSILPFLMLHFSRKDVFIQLKLIQLIGEMHTPASYQFLEKVLQSNSISVKSSALEALIEARYEPSPLILNTISRQIDLEIQQLHDLVTRFMLVPVDDITVLLRGALRRSMHFLAQSLLLNLTFFYSREFITKARIALETYGPAEVGYAAELLDSILGAPHKKAVVHLMMLTYGEETSEYCSADLTFGVLGGFLRESEDSLEQLICAAAIFIISTLSLGEFSREIDAFSHSKIDLIRETALYCKAL
jgi:AAA family ATP:ADP antiporter